MDGQTAEVKPKLLLNDIEDLRSLINRTFEGFEVEKGGRKLHPYGEVNIEKERSSFDGNIAHIRELLEHYKFLHSTHQERGVTRYLNLLKDRATMSGQVDKIKSSLAECQVMAEDYLAHRTLSKQKLMINNLQSISKSLHLEFYSFPVGDDDMATDMTADPAVQTNVSLEAMISSAAFVVDVIVDAQGEVQQANVSYTPEAGEEALTREEVNRELYGLLRAGDMKQIETKLKKLNELQIVYQHNPNPEIRKALKIFEDDILALYQREITGSGMETVLLHQHGIPEYQIEGLCIHYHASPMALLKYKSKGMVRWADTSSAVIGLRELSEPIALPLFSHLSETVGGYITERVIFDLNLKPPLPMALSVLHKLLGKEQVSSPGGFGFPSFHNLLYQDITGDSQGLEKRSFAVKSGVEGKKLSYIFNTGSEAPGVIVEHIPITHITQILPVFQLLRQQVVFNELFKSCFGGYSSLRGDGVGDGMDEGEVPVVEVACQPPHGLNITMLHPVTQNLLCVSVVVLLGGQVQAQVHNLPGENTPMPSSTYISNILTQCLSIPLMMKYLLNHRNK